MTPTAKKPSPRIWIAAVTAMMLFAFAGTALATDLQESHQGTEWDATGFTCPAEDLAMIDEGEVLWHFILNGAESGQTITLTADFTNAGTLQDVGEEAGSSGTYHFYIVTDIPDTLEDASTDESAANNLVLSHICFKEEATPTPTATTTPTPTATTTPTPTATTTPTPTATTTPTPTLPDTAVTTTGQPGGGNAAGAAFLLLLVGSAAALWMVLRPVARRS